MGIGFMGDATMHASVRVQLKSQDASRRRRLERRNLSALVLDGTPELGSSAKVSKPEITAAKETCSCICKPGKKICERDMCAKHAESFRRANIARELDLDESSNSDLSITNQGQRSQTFLESLSQRVFAILHYGQQPGQQSLGELLQTVLAISVLLLRLKQIERLQ